MIFTLGTGTYFSYKKSIYRFMPVLFLCLLMGVGVTANAAPPLNLKDAQVSVMSLEMKAAGSVASFTKRKLEFEIKISHPRYNIIGFDEKKTTVNALYGSNGKNLLRKSRATKSKGWKVSMCMGSSCKAGFSVLGVNEHDLFLSFSDKKIVFESLQNLGLDADIYVYAVPRGADKKHSLLKNIELGLSKQIFEVDDFQMTIAPNRGSQTRMGRKSYGFNIKSNIFIMDFDIVSLDGTVLDTIKLNVDKTIYIPEEYFGSAVNLKVRYYEAASGLVSVQKFLLP